MSWATEDGSSKFIGKPQWGSSHISNPDSLSTTLLSQSCILETAPTVGIESRRYPTGRGGVRSLQLPGTSSQVNPRSYPLQDLLLLFPRIPTPSVPISFITSTGTLNHGSWHPPHLQNFCRSLHLSSCSPTLSASLGASRGDDTRSSFSSLGPSA